MFIVNSPILSHLHHAVPSENTPPTESAIFKEQSTVIEQLLSQQTPLKVFPKELEDQYWQTMQARSISLLQRAYLPIMLTYLIFGLFSGLRLYWLLQNTDSLHDLWLWLTAYGTGAICLGVLVAIPFFNRLILYYSNIILGLTFLNTVTVCLSIMNFNMDTLREHTGYIIIYIYMLAYFLGSTEPKAMLITCSLAGIISLSSLYCFQQMIDYDLCFYVFILGNFLGFSIASMIAVKDRIGFLQERLLALDRIQNEQLNLNLQRLNQEDVVTGLSNRRYLNESIEHKWLECHQQRQPISIIFCDIDHFKAYNDFYGHLKGDETLYKVAQALKKTLGRKEDIVARYGGEEFVILLANTDAIGAWTVAYRLLMAIDRLEIPHERSATYRYVTGSIGIATLYPADDPLLTSDVLIDRADQAVYEAKIAGRHCVRVYGQGSIEC